MKEAKKNIYKAFLGPDDPAPFEIINKKGRTPLVLFCDHAGQSVPRRLDNLGLGQKELNYHIGYDIGTRRLGLKLSHALDCPLVLCNYSRLVIDCNREPGDETSIPSISDGIRIPGNQDLSQDDINCRIDHIFTPYHQAIDQTIASLQNQDIIPGVFSIHSFTPELMSRHEDRPWHCAILWKRDPRLATPLLEMLSREKAMHVGNNTPYSGWEDAYSIDRHGADYGLPYCAIEIRQDLLGDETHIETWARRLTDYFKVILAERSPFSITPY